MQINIGIVRGHCLRILSENTIFRWSRYPYRKIVIAFLRKIVAETYDTLTQSFDLRFRPEFIHYFLRGNISNDRLFSAEKQEQKLFTKIERCNERWIRS